MCQGFSVMQSQPPRHHDHQPPLIPDRTHLTSDHLHLPFSKQVTFKSIKHSVNDRPVYRSLPWTIPVSRLRFTCLHTRRCSSAPLILISSTPARSRISLQKTASAFPDKNPSTAQSFFTYLLTITSVSLCNSFNKPTCVCINPLPPVLNCDSMSVAFVEWIFVDSPTWSGFSVI